MKRFFLAFSIILMASMSLAQVEIEGDGQEGIILGLDEDDDAGNVTIINQFINVSELGLINGTFGSMYIIDESTITITVPGLNQYVNVTPFFDGERNLVDFEHSNSLNLQEGGFYVVGYAISFRSSSNQATDTQFAIAINGVVSNRTITQRATSGTDVGAASAVQILDLAFDDQITLVLRDEISPARDVEVHSAQVVIQKLETGSLDEGTLNETYLRLDASNDPVTGDLVINAGGIWRFGTSENLTLEGDDVYLGNSSNGNFQFHFEDDQGQDTMSYGNERFVWTAGHEIQGGNISMIPLAGAPVYVTMLSTALNQIRYFFDAVTNHLVFEGDADAVNFTFGLGFLNQSRICTFINCPTFNETYDIFAYNQTTGGADGQGLVDTDPPYLYDNTSKVFFNESVLNMTIAVEGVIIGFNSTFNETYDIFAYNQTVEGADGQGLVDTDPPYLYDNMSKVFFNETFLNMTINYLIDNDEFHYNQTQAGADGVGIAATDPPYLFDNGSTAFFNESFLNGTINYLIDNDEFHYNQSDGSFNATYDEFAYNQSDGGPDGQGLVDTDPPYLYDNMSKVFFNETFLNGTINYLIDNDEFHYNQTQAGADGVGISATDPPYLYDNGSTAFFNETFLNITINDLIDSDEFHYNQTIPAITYTDLQISINNASWTSTFNITYHTFAYNQTEAGADGRGLVATTFPYLFDNGTTVFFNETMLNMTIAVEGVIIGFNSTFNETYDTFAYNQSDGGGVDSGTLNDTYLLLDASNDPVTGHLTIKAGGLWDFGNTENMTFVGDDFYFGNSSQTFTRMTFEDEDGTNTIRHSDNTFEFMGSLEVQGGNNLSLTSADTYSAALEFSNIAGATAMWFDASPNAIIVTSQDPETTLNFSMNTGFLNNSEICKFNGNCPVFNSTYDDFAYNQTEAGADGRGLVATTPPYLSDNGTTIFFDESQLNMTIAVEGVIIGFNSTFNSTYDTFAYNQSGATLDNTNIAYLNNTQTFTEINTFEKQGIFETGLNISATHAINFPFPGFPEFDSKIMANSLMLDIITPGLGLNSTTIYVGEAAEGTTTLTFVDSAGQSNLVYDNDVITTDVDHVDVNGSIVCTAGNDACPTFNETYDTFAYNQSGGGTLDNTNIAYLNNSQQFTGDNQFQEGVNISAGKRLVFNDFIPSLDPYIQGSFALMELNGNTIRLNGSVLSVGSGAGSTASLAFLANTDSGSLTYDAARDIIFPGFGFFAMQEGFALGFENDLAVNLTSYDSLNMTIAAPDSIETQGLLYNEGSRVCTVANGLCAGGDTDILGIDEAYLSLVGENDCGTYTYNNASLFNQTFCGGTFTNIIPSVNITYYNNTGVFQVNVTGLYEITLDLMIDNADVFTSWDEFGLSFKIDGSQTYYKTLSARNGAPGPPNSMTVLQDLTAGNNISMNVWDESISAGTPDYTFTKSRTINIRRVA